MPEAVRMVAAIPKTVESVRWGLNEDEQPGGQSLMNRLRGYERKEFERYPEGYVHVAPGAWSLEGFGR
jgi:hypothetical protein